MKKEKRMPRKPTSKRTALGNSNQIPKLFKKVESIQPWRSGSVNLDYGSGPYYKHPKDFLATKGVEYYPFDPYNLPTNDNVRTIIYLLTSKTIDTITISNVLNVIKYKDERTHLLVNAMNMIAPQGFIFISIYEGDKSGQGRQNGDSWQENRTTRDFLEEIKETLPDAQMKYGIIYWQKK